MKKGRENYAAREAIKFLEKSLEGGGRLVRVQKDTETLQPGRRKPPRQDLQTWCVLACSVSLFSLRVSLFALPCLHYLRFEPSQLGCLGSSVGRSTGLVTQWSRVQIPSEAAQFFSLSAFGLCLTLSCLPLHITCTRFDHVHYVIL